VEEALHNRRTAFLVGLGFCVLVSALALLTAPAAEKASRPNTLTLIFVIYALGSELVWHWWFLRPDQVIGMADRQGSRASLARMAWLLSVMGLAGLIGPVVLGVILYQISGEIWRLLLLAGIGIAGGALLYLRIGQDLHSLSDHGLVGWNPGGPHPG
jgi:hypothetical protein